MSDFYLPSGAGGNDDYDVEVTPESASWGYSSLRVLTLPPAGTHTLSTGDSEVLVVPLSGTTTTSASSVSRVWVPAGGSVSTRRLECPQDADSGVTSTS